MKLKTLTNKPALITLLALALVIICAWMVYYSLKQATPNTKSSLSPADGAYLNKYGQKWWLNNPGKNVLEFTGNTKVGPEIVKGTIDPLKVSVGQKQTMELEINSSIDLKKVVAFIHTDNNVIEVELKQTGVRELTYEDVNNRQAFVKDDGELVLKTELENDPKYALKAFVDSLFLKAKANNKQRYTFSGDWIVYDTRETTYKTVFVATDNNGQENRITMAWSDPCTLPVSKNISDWPKNDEPLNGHSGKFINNNNQYQFATTVCSEDKLDGIENVDYVVPSGSNVTIPVGTIIRTPGKKIIVQAGGQISFPDANGQNPNIGKITKGYLWIYDNDGDTYFPQDALSASSTHPIQYTTTNSAPTAYNSKKLKFVLNKVLSIFDTAKAQTGSGWQRKDSVTDANNFLKPTSPIVDCDDMNGNVHPGQSLYFSSAITGGGPKNGTFDYDCSGNVEFDPVGVLASPQNCNLMTFSTTYSYQEIGTTTCATVTPSPIIPDLTKNLCPETSLNIFTNVSISLCGTNQLGSNWKALAKPPIYYYNGSSCSYPTFSRYTEYIPNWNGAIVCK